jgi:hypothetical protein
MRFKAADADGIAEPYTDHAGTHQVGLEPVNGKIKRYLPVAASLSPARAVNSMTRCALFPFFKSFGSS